MVKEKYLKKTIINNIKEFIKLIEFNDIKVKRVILFGSHAKGTAKAESDIDVLIVSPQFGKDAIQEMMMLRKLAIKVDSHIEPIPFSPKDLLDRYSTLSQEIQRYGIELKVA